MLSIENADYRSRAKFLKRIKRWLEEKGITFIKLSKELGLQRSSVSLWFSPVDSERPLIDMHNIAKLSKISGITYVTKSDSEKQTLELITNGGTNEYCIKKDGLKKHRDSQRPRN